MTNWTEELTDEQKKQVWDFIVFTVKEIREQVAMDIEYTYEVWSTHGKAKSRQTKKAFMVCADIARGLNERIPDNGGSKSDTSKG
jgi:hypothetical protein